MLQFTQKDIDRFWSKVDKTSNPKGCWIWITGKRNGYGHFSIAFKDISAHRFSYELHYGKIPDGLKVLHTCDNRPCMRPDHLFLGTNQDNSNDMVKKNRQAKGLKNGAYTHPEKTPRGDKHYSRLHPEKLAHAERNGKYTHPEKTPHGEQHGMAKLTNEQVIEIRNKYKPFKYSLIKLAKEFKVSKRTILNIIHQKIWKHI